VDKNGRGSFDRIAAAVAPVCAGWALKPMSRFQSFWAPNRLFMPKAELDATHHVPPRRRNPMLRQRWLFLLGSAEAVKTTFAVWARPAGSRVQTFPTALNPKTVVEFGGIAKNPTNHEPWNRAIWANSRATVVFKAPHCGKGTDSLVERFMGKTERSGVIQTTPARARWAEIGEI